MINPPAKKQGIFRIQKYDKTYLIIDADNIIDAINKAVEIRRMRDCNEIIAVEELKAPEFYPR